MAHQIQLKACQPQLLGQAADFVPYISSLSLPAVHWDCCYKHWCLLFYIWSQTYHCNLLRIASFYLDWFWKLLHFLTRNRWSQTWGSPAVLYVHYHWFLVHRSLPSRSLTNHNISVPLRWNSLSISPHKFCLCRNSYQIYHMTDLG